MAKERLQCAGVYKPPIGAVFQQGNSATRNPKVNESLIKNHTKVLFKIQNRCLIVLSMRV